MLEIGGALPDRYVFDYLAARSWTAVEYRNYNHSQYSTSTGQDYHYDCSGWANFFRNWKLFNRQKFDLIYSISAFEHIYDLQECLIAMHAMLFDGGLLYAYFSPIWSARNGSHGFHPKEIHHLGGHCHRMFTFSSLAEYLTNEFGFSD